MILKNQQAIMADISMLAAKKQHNILISGTEECGKTYLAKLFTKELGIEDFQVIESKITSIKDTIDACIGSTTPLVLCIENLDTGVNAVSYAMLKFLEEPSENIYIVITCRNVRRIPDTIISRCVTVNLSHMDESDLISYAKENDPIKYAELRKDEILWKCVKSIKDVDLVLGMTAAQIGYIQALSGVFKSKESVSTIVWRLQKYQDGTQTPIELVVRYLLYINSDSRWFSACHRCLSALSECRIGTHAVLSKLAFELKYS